MSRTGSVILAGAVAAIAVSGPAARAGWSSVTMSAPPSWRTLPKAPIAGRLGASAVWTGRQMLVWGGVSRSVPEHAERRSDGATYNPATRTWRGIARSPAGVLGDGGKAAAWTGHEMVVWAGNSPEGPSGGATYDPRTNKWRRLPHGPLGVREGYASAWTGTELLILGGHTGAIATPTAAAVDPRTRSWRQLPALNVIKNLGVVNGAVWDGHEAIVSGSGVLIAVNPNADTFHRISLAKAPIEPRRRLHLDPIGWTGTEVVFSTAADGPSSSVEVVRYNPTSDSWKNSRAAPCAGSTSQVAWIGDRLVTACRTSGLQIYTPRTDSWRTIKSGPSPFNSSQDSAIVWSGTALIVWSGTVSKPGNPTPADGASIAFK
jgi:hypothetical protein